MQRKRRDCARWALAATAVAAVDFCQGCGAVAMRHCGIIQGMTNQAATGLNSTAPRPGNAGQVTAAWALIFCAWLVATASALGALFLGEVMGHAPCVLCWYQRAAMFPLVWVLAAGLFPLDRRVVRYALPLALVGLAVSLFHLALIAGWVPEGARPCEQGVPCATAQVMWFGFVTIPLLSALSFSSIAGLLLAAHFKGSSK